MGSASHSGCEAYNDQLSLNRAVRISELLNQAVPGIDQKTQALGRGFLENVIGIGSDVLWIGGWNLSCWLVRDRGAFLY